MRTQVNTNLKTLKQKTIQTMSVANQALQELRMIQLLKRNIKTIIQKLKDLAASSPQCHQPSEIKH